MMMLEVKLNFDGVFYTQNVDSISCPAEKRGTIWVTS